MKKERIKNIKARISRNRINNPIHRIKQIMSSFSMILGLDDCGNLYKLSKDFKEWEFILKSK